MRNKTMNKKSYQKDIEIILSHRYDNGDDLWTTEDKKLLKEYDNKNE